MSVCNFGGEVGFDALGVCLYCWICQSVVTDSIKQNDPGKINFYTAEK